jgi:hypothetical protein
MRFQEGEHNDVTIELITNQFLRASSTILLMISSVGLISKMIAKNWIANQICSLEPISSAQIISTSRSRAG